MRDGSSSSGPSWAISLAVVGEYTRSDRRGGRREVSFGPSFLLTRGGIDRLKNQDYVKRPTIG
jgi:hypothetical protein